MAIVISSPDTNESILLCEYCFIREADYYDSGSWYCEHCIEEIVEDKDSLCTPIEWARMYWGYAEIIK